MSFFISLLIESNFDDLLDCISMDNMKVKMFGILIVPKIRYHSAGSVLFGNLFSHLPDHLKEFKEQIVILIPEGNE